MLSWALLNTYVWRYGVIGSAAFTVLVFFLFKTGLVFAARTRDGLLKKEMPLIGYLAMSTVFFGVLWIHVYGYIDMLRYLSIELTFWDIYWLNYCLYLFLFAYDTFVIDLLVLVYWRPSFLDIPDAVGFTSARHHLKTIPVGVVAGAIGTMVSTTLIWYLL